MSIKVYNQKRNFNQTPEPPGKKSKPPQGKNQDPLRFVIQLHQASRLHFDFRLEFDGVFKSWAVPKGPSLNPQEQRLAVFVEDHPLEYGSFEGIIPKGNYGAGTVMLWDVGTYTERSSSDRKQSQTAMMKGLQKGHLTFVLEGQKLRGEFALVKLHRDPKAWLLIKKRDEYSTYKQNQILDHHSIKTGRTLQEIAQASLKEGNVWLSQKGRRVTTPKKTTPSQKPRTKTNSDPMPRKNKPMLATASRTPLPSNDWIFEKDHQGLRALAEIEGKSVHLYSKSGLPFEKKFPEIVTELKSLNLQAVLDGEIITTSERPRYSVFDVLYSQGKDLRKESLKIRKKVLKELLPKGKLVQASQTEVALKKSTGLFIAKNLESPYRPGTSSDWVILQNSRSAPVLKASKKMLPEARRNLEKSHLTNLDKLYFPQDGITKGDLLSYYEQIAPFILPYLKDRPESLNRHPDGITRPGFYQKDMTGHIPRWLKTTRIFSESVDKSIDYAVCQDKRSLLYLVNLGCIELNPWFSRIDHLDHPDFLVIDLDPDGNNFDHVIDIAQEFHQILDKIGAKNVCKTSGATGIHIGVPVGARYDFDQVRAFAEMLCKRVAKKYPATTSIDRNPNRRRKKIYLDYMQNRRGQTLAAPYCVRPRAGAPVSMPVTWNQLRHGFRPEQFHLRNVIPLLQKQKDPWKGVLGHAIDLNKCVIRLQEQFKA